MNTSKTADVIRPKSFEDIVGQDHLFGKNGVNEGEKGSHYAPDYEYVLSRGIGGIIEDIEKSKSQIRKTMI